MPLTFDHDRGTYTLEDVDHPVLRKFFRRVEPQGDAADFVQVRGLHHAFEDEIGTGGLVLQCVEFGAVPDGWDSATVVYDIADFESEYERYEPSATEHGLASAEASAQATAAAEAARIDAEARHLAAVQKRAAEIAKEKTR